MSYVIVLVATALGVLGVLFSRRNQFKILSPASQILLWLIVLAGIAAVIDTAYKDDAINAANKRVRQGDERLQALASGGKNEGGALPRRWCHPRAAI